MRWFHVCIFTHSCQVDLFHTYTKILKNQIFIILAYNTLSGVTNERCPSPRLCTRAHTSRL